MMLRIEISFVGSSRIGPLSSNLELPLKADFALLTAVVRRRRKAGAQAHI
jgi:hypothetical protein